MFKGKKILAIIPVRSGSKGIPRKNRRLLAGKPLLSYSIEKCLKSKYIDEVYVTSESLDLREVAERFGAKSISRSAKLAADDVGLDEVITDTTSQIELRDTKNYDFIVSIQATSPLIETKSIDSAIEKCINERYSTVVSAVCDNHLRWQKNSSGKIIPLYRKRINRQFLNGTFKETGGFVVFKRELLKNKTRFGENIALHEVNKKESIDIDDYYDWWLAEKTLLRKKICFHLVGSRTKGLGHVYRCLTLADRMIDHEIQFVVNNQNELAIKKIQNHYYNLVVCQKGEELEAILNSNPMLCINDVLDTDTPYIRSLKEAGILTINFEDLGEGSILADAVINSMYDYHPYLKNGTIYHGVNYCCLRDEFYYTKPKNISQDVENILVMFGGTDQNRLTEKIINWLDEIEGKWKITVILGLGYKHLKDIKNLAKQLNHEIEIIMDTSFVSKYMKECDIAITAAGRTVFELAALGIPMITISSSKRELSHYFAHKSFGIISLGFWTNLMKNKFQDIVLELLNSSLMRQKMSQSLQNENLFKGIDNVLDIINNVLKNRI